MLDDRARLTIPFVAQLLMVMGILAGLWPVFWGLLQDNVDQFSTGTAYLWQLVLPLSVVVLLALMFRTAVRGGA